MILNQNQIMRLTDCGKVRLTLIEAMQVIRSNSKIHFERVGSGHDKLYTGQQLI